MRNTDSIWLELFIFSTALLAGNILFARFEERTSRWRRLGKSAIILCAMAAILIFLGKAVALTLFGLSLLPVLYIHAILLPRKGIDGWTGEPKGRYYEFRGWDKDIFKDDARGP